eukprot:CAMPEP_0116904502 /NCGR_PEP_ID=MMETSP0467-20121206/11472_1 /TAXON_ID=283647 /ORGANISM="Mesodinium pulex, Strain SPMC105" /LENGTH=37 /DNA_ID= /DNA_START= /DNA_END= /DNA_ORIENTATION=
MTSTVDVLAEKIPELQTYHQSLLQLLNTESNSDIKFV